MGEERRPPSAAVNGVAKIRLVCIDVDGTLVGASGTAKPAVWDAVERARSAGLQLALSSGRPCFGITRELALRMGPAGWHSFQNGASVIDIASGSSLSAGIDTSVVRALVARAGETGRLLELYSDDSYAFVGESERSRRHAELLGVPFEPRPIESLAGPVVRALWLLPHDEVAAVMAEPRTGLEISRSTSPVMPDTCFVNMTREGVDKGTALRAIAEETGTRLDEMMYVGDGHNDVVAMRLVGFPIAMGNADADAKEAAARTVASVEDDGLVEALELALTARAGA